MSKNNIDSSPKHNLSFTAFIKRFSREAFYIDSRLFRTIHSLLTRPGHLTVSYFKEHDNKFIQPLKLYFAINLIFFLLVPLLTTARFQIFSFTMESIGDNIPAYQTIIENQIQSNGISFEIYNERFNAHLKYNQPALVFIIIPLYAILIHLVNLKMKRFFIEHLLFSTHFFSFFLLATMTILISFRSISAVMRLFSNGSDSVIAIVVLLTYLCWLPIYMFLCLKRFYELKAGAAVLKTFLLMVGFIIPFGIYVHFLFFFTILALNLGY